MPGRRGQIQFIHHDLGNLRGGEVVEVSLSGSAANVRLMDSANFSSFRAGRRHRYQGGLARQSPVRLQVPRRGHWHVTVDMMGLQGQVRSSARFLPRALQPLPEPPLSSIPSLLRDDVAPSGDDDDGRRFDVFISHASEDKDDVVRPLAEALRAEQLEVWYDEFELRIGSSLRRTIDRGIARSRFGVVVLSPAFLGKGWPEYELDGLVTRSVHDEQILLPIWHHVSKSEVMSHSASLADKLARSTATHTVAEIAREIAEVVRGEARSGS
ncbi:MAG: DUF1883 domain-containing protein [Planctomycetota bacterium]